MGGQPLRKLWIPGPVGRLEATLRGATRTRGAAVVAHPHPRHGGTLDNPVVFHTDRQLFGAGLSTLRFNFRGVGSSDGQYDSGAGEVEDLGAAVSWLRDVVAGVPLFIVGYSFGALCAIRHAIGDSKVTGLIAIGLPPRRYDFDEIEKLPCPLAVVQGSRDEFGSLEDVRAVLRRAAVSSQLRVIRGSGHRFTDSARRAAGAVVESVESMLGKVEHIEPINGVNAASPDE
jgi:alpha/beta superfamily hydrolase